MISFDQFQRYATIGKIISSVVELKHIDRRLKILEVGANSQRNLEKFVDAEIFYTDIDELEEFKGDDHFFVADATNLCNISDNEFDMVIASDVFEHIPGGLREAFLSEIIRVAGEFAIVCFPFESDSNKNVELRTNQYYKTIYGEDYIWLKEHIENGLPDLEMVNSLLDKKGIYYSVCGQGEVGVWEEMMKAHFYAAAVTELIDYRFNIDKYYEENVYSYDVGDNNYRVFYMISKSMENKTVSDKIMPKLFKNNSEIREAGYKKIISLCNDLHNLGAAKTQRTFNSKYADSYATCYFNSGDGYSEENKQHFMQIYLDGLNEFVIDGLMKRHVSEIRFDFIENYMCEVFELSILSDTGKELRYRSNGLKYDDILLFRTTDPQIIIPVEKDMDRITISFYINIMLSPIQKKSFIFEWNRITELNDTKKELYKMKNRYESVLNDYNLTLASTSWKITGPMRAAVTLFGKIRIFDYIREFFYSLFHEGIRQTARRVKDRILKIRSKQYEFKEITVEEVEENILFSILVPLYNTDTDCLKELLDSIVSQTYSNWELCLGDASNKNTDAIEKICMDYQRNDARIKYFKIEQNNGISENTNACARRAEGDYIVLCDHDDILAKEALRANAWMIQNTGADVLYSDEDHIDKKGNHILPLFKPDWSPDLLRSQMYVCHLFVFRKSLFWEVGGLNKLYDGSQDYDLMLRFSERTDKVMHIPLILYSWREIETSTSVNADSKPYADEAGRNALSAHLKRVFGESAYAVSTDNAFLYGARYGIVDKEKPLISIIIPMKDQYELSKQCIESIMEKTSYRNFEIILINNRSEQKKTLIWLEAIEKENDKVKVINADFDFNWSKINNFGMEHANGDVFIFLNNDTLVKSEDWLDRLSDNALRDDIGVVGPMLLYEDGSIQHAGIVVGMGGWADHVFKEMLPIHYASPYISPVVTRNVMAVTGACMAISRKTIDKIGVFDEEFIICGSDVEICIRAYNHGLNNLYLSDVSLYHLESKSRDSYIPEIDFKKSYECYAICREYGDPYYNINLDINSVRPKEDSQVDWEKIKRHMRANRFTAKLYDGIKKKIIEPSAMQQSVVAEVQEIKARAVKLSSPQLRINILVPSVDVKHVFGGISTALSFYTKLTEGIDCKKRIIVTDAPVYKDTMVDLPGYHIADAMDNGEDDCRIIPLADRAQKTLAVSKNDIFVATGWWTAYTIADVIRWQKAEFKKENPLIYMIQDYEPGFYPWSSRYMMADSTYRLEIPTIAVINSKELKDFLDLNNYSFYRSLCYVPTLNTELKEHLFNILKNADGSKKKQIMVYGRPGVERNAFALIVNSLKRWVQMQEDIEEWSIISAGEAFEDIELGKGKVLHSIGKVSLKEYAEIMAETKVGVSLMVSPHPSYPPLEMSTFGVKVITNSYGNKDLSSFNENIVSLSSCSAEEISNTIYKLCTGKDGKFIQDSEYVKNSGSAQWDDITKEIYSVLEG